MRVKLVIPVFASLLILGNIMVGGSFNDAFAGGDPSVTFCHSDTHDQQPPWSVLTTNVNGWNNGHNPNGDILIDDGLGGSDITEEECLALNEQSNSLHISKFYDANVNGVKDLDELFISDWLVEIAEFESGTDVIATSFTTLTTAWIEDIEGDVLISEASEDNWVPTNQEVPPILITEFNSDATVTIASNTRITVEGEKIVEFGNVCLGEGGANSKGFWTNKNGQELIDGDDLITLNALTLINADGSDQNFGSNSDVKTFLKQAKAKNMANMLSAQLAAMQLNVNHGFVDPTSFVYAPGVDELTNFLTIQELMDIASTEIDNNPDTTSSNDNRDYQELIKNVLDDANNNTNFVQPDICSPFVAEETPV